jgi:hypothetical protein
LIKINRFKSARNKIPYTYILTPRGLEEKARLTVSFLKRKLSEYEEIRRQIRELAQEVDSENLMDLSFEDAENVVRRLP